MFSAMALNTLTQYFFQDDHLKIIISIQMSIWILKFSKFSIFQEKIYFLTISKFMDKILFL